MTMELGIVPEELKLNLTAGGGFRARIEAFEEDGTTPASFPVGTVIELRLSNDVKWPAVINENVITWDVPSELVSLSYNAAKASLWIVSESGRDEPWFVGGPVSRHG